MSFDVANASLSELEAKFDELAAGRTAHYQEYTTARSAFEAALTEFDEIFGKIAIIDAISDDLLGTLGETDGSPGDNPFSTDLLDVVDDALAVGGAIGSLASLAKLGWDIRRARALNSAARLADGAGSAAGKAVVAWPKLKLAGGVASAAVSALGFYLMERDAQERRLFYKTNIPLYESWYADLTETTASFVENTQKLNDELDDLQSKLGYNSRAEMKFELQRQIGVVAEYRAQYVAATKMLCGGKLTRDEVEDFTGLPRTLIDRRAQEIEAPGSTVCADLSS